MNALADFTQFSHDINNVLKSDNIITRYIQRFAYGTDASFYRLVPELVLRVENVHELKQVLFLATKHNVATTFRAAGTSLSGQAITDSVLIIYQPIGKKLLFTGKVSKSPYNRALLVLMLTKLYYLMHAK